MKNTKGSRRARWEHLVEDFARRVVSWQGRCALRLQDRMARLSLVNQRRIWWLFLVIGSLCICFVLIHPFVSKETVYSRWGVVRTLPATPAVCLPNAPTRIQLFPPIYERFSAAFDSVRLRGNAPIYPLPIFPTSTLQTERKNIQP